MTEQHAGAVAGAEHEHYYVPHDSKIPVWLAFGLILFMYGFGSLLNATKTGEHGNPLLIWAGLAVVGISLYTWFTKVIRENHAGLAGAQLKRSYVWGMGWFIFSEVMFFAAFFGALFYVRNFAMPWLGGEGEKGITGEYLWPGFAADWEAGRNPSEYKPGPAETMAAPTSASAWAGYLPFWNTAILLSSSFTIHWAHTALKSGHRKGLTTWLGITVALGVVFLFLQAEEYLHAYEELGLTLGSGIYGSTFYILTGFHGFHVTLGTFMLLMCLVRVLKGHFSKEDHFGFEACSWYWHFVDVVWMGLFLFVYVL
ncbi:MAG: cytochrome c oxidase subunit 3 [Pseudomonadales bacterium]|jgi:cytochrome c oxidase subunit 3|nr:cytochrome c oxidase subunit 3 [Pseudomonadales bacterium]